MERITLKSDEEEGQYFDAPERNIPRIPSGCCLLDLVLSGGWAERRIINIVGDKSTGKTLLAIEASKNFADKYEDGEIVYDEVESAFDVPYARTVGLPMDRVTLIDGEHDTVEDVYEYIDKWIARRKKRRPGLYIIDSLDALSDRAEEKRELTEGTFGANKAKQMSQIFRRMVRKISKANITLIIVSQVRDAIGVMFGDRHTRSGGKALDFYASQVIYLSQVDRIVKTSMGLKRPIGVRIRAMLKKSKCGPPFRDCEFPIMFNFGIDDVVAAVEWLKTVGRLDAIDLKSEKAAALYIKQVMKTGGKSYAEERDRVAEQLKPVWKEVEDHFLPARRKYA